MRSQSPRVPPMVVDCDACPVRGVRCDDCVVTALAGLPVVVLRDGQLPLDAAENRALNRFVAAGLVAPDDAARVTARREPWAGHQQAAQQAAG